ncbi:MAG: hypothetical protein KIS94_14075 [Chitinophagales bacterium]|nr:hypothetical protein [Chitinophagales bacterium]
MRFLVTLFSLLVTIKVANGQITPIPHSHAHNDYLHKRPLLNALENGFTSIEIDVFLHKDKLVVSHVGIALSTKKTLEELYLEPAKEIIAQNNGWVYSTIKKPVVFMIDFKTESTATYEKLKEILARYPEIITTYKGDSVIEQRAINILISGSSPISSLQKEERGLATIDANISNIANPEVRKVSTRFSSSWSRYFKWRGISEIPANEKSVLDSLVTLVHSYNKDIRFWAIPDKPSVWKTLLDAGVDWINTDKLSGYRKFYGDIAR